MSTPPPKSVFTLAQKNYIKKAIGVAAAATLVVVGALQVQVTDLKEQVKCIKHPELCPSPTPTPTPSPSTTPSASSSATPTSPTSTPTVTPTPTTSPSTSPSVTPTPTPGPLPGPNPTGPGGGVFSVTCNFDHQAPDDPIVYHGVPGAAHLHQFFGAEGVTANTVPSDLASMPTTCLNPGDHAAYWAPALVSDTGVIFQPKSIFAYYQTSTGSPARAFPAGLVMVADSFSDPSGKSGFSCSDQGPFAPLPYDCPDKTVGHEHFPDCWDGVHLDSPDHRSHMSYSKGGTCDAAHPVLLVQLRVHVQYVGLKNGSHYHIVPNPDSSFPKWHADFEMGWLPGVLEKIMSTCINTGDMCKQDKTIGN